MQPFQRPFQSNPNPERIQNGVQPIGEDALAVIGRLDDHGAGMETTAKESFLDPLDKVTPGNASEQNREFSYLGCETFPRPKLDPDTSAEWEAQNRIRPRN